MVWAWNCRRSEVDEDGDEVEDEVEVELQHTKRGQVELQVCAQAMSDDEVEHAKWNTRSGMYDDKIKGIRPLRRFSDDVIPILG